MKTIFVPKARIRGTKFSAAYKPVPDVDDTIIVRGTINGAGEPEEGAVRRGREARESRCKPVGSGSRRPARWRAPHCTAIAEPIGTVVRTTPDFPAPTSP